MKYRPDIDGLRAVAVIPVVLFHLGIPVLFGGGYSGVDIFFVISGFLITTIIYNEMKSGTFTFRAFYERRVRRILPPVILVAIFSIIVASIIVNPVDRKEFFVSLRSVFIFMPNNYFANNTRGYWHSNTETMPMLHMWSLGIEEQFYIFFPLLLMLVFKFVPKHVLKFFIALGLTSFVLCVIQHGSNAGFYVLFYRAWELIAGAVVAIATFEIKSERRKNILGLLGLFVLIAGVCALKFAGKWPNAWTLCPVLGTAFCIMSGANSMSGKILSAKPLVHIGKLSFSIYLWHWPLIVFAKYWLGDWAMLPIVWRFGIVISTYLISLISYKFYENKIRHKEWLSERCKLFTIAVIVCLSLFLIASYYKSNRYFRKAYPEYYKLRTSSAAKINDRIKSDENPINCFLIGDSHMTSMSSTFLEILEELPERKCAMLTFTETKLEKMGEKIGEKLNELLAPYSWNPENIDTVIIIRSFVGNKGTKVIEGTFSGTLEWLKNMGVKAKIYVNRPTPRYSNTKSIQQLIFQNKAPTITVEEFEEWRKELNNKLENFEGIELFDYGKDFLCDKERCYSVMDGKILYQDTNHLSVNGAACMKGFFHSLLAK